MIDGKPHVFDSKLEMDRYGYLKLFEKQGLIKDLKLQPAFCLIEAFECEDVKYRAIGYKADFQYIRVYHDPRSKEPYKYKTIVEDAKGMKTQEYILKKKLLLSQPHDFLFREVTYASALPGAKE
jgi:hypothetical protein